MSRHQSSDEALPRLEHVRPLDGRRVLVVWKGGKQQTVDVSPALLSKRVFIRLRTDDELFRQMRVNEYGNAVEWPDGAELSAIWIERLAPASIDNDDFREAMEELGLSLEGMAARLGVSRRLVADYRKDKPIPELVGLAVLQLMDLKKRAG